MSESYAGGKEWWRLVVSVDCSFVDDVQAILEDSGLEDYVLWQEEQDERGYLFFYRETGAELVCLRDIIVPLFDSGSMAGRVSINEERVKPEDWENSWKSFFHAGRISEHIVVRPSWEGWRGEEGDIEVVIDPGMSFGTGLHQTTRACIRFIDRLSEEGGMMLDAGCGSGILSIAAVKLGFGPVWAIDNDPVAVECAERNFLENGVAGRVDLRCLSLDDLDAKGLFDLAVVNILAPVIMANADLIAASLVPVTGRLVLAGILNSQFGEIASCFEGKGFGLTERADDGEWSSGLFVRLPKPG